MTPARFPISLLVLPIVVVLALSGCNGSITFSQDVEAVGDLVTVPFDVEDFDSLDVSNSFEVFVEIGETASVEVLVNESLVDDLDIRVRNGELNIGLRDGVSVRNGTLEATIRMPVLEAIDLSGASDTEIVDFDGSSLRADVSGASDLTVSGSATTVNIDASGSSNINVRLDDVQSAVIDLSGASSLDLESANRVIGDMSGASSLVVPSDTQVTVDTSGASSISRR